MKFQLPYAELQFQYTRSRGPGGQNVNRTNSACQLRWNASETLCFSAEIKGRILRNLSSQLTEAGEILIRSDQFRDQDSNRKACLERLIEIIEKALFIPKARKKTRPKKSAIKKRLESKGHRGEVKALRQKVHND